jgi:CDP-diglyceride synthetase
MRYTILGFAYTVICVVGFSVLLSLISGGQAWFFAIPIVILVCAIGALRDDLSFNVLGRDLMGVA